MLTQISIKFFFIWSVTLPEVTHKLTCACGLQLEADQYLNLKDKLDCQRYSRLPSCSIEGLGIQVKWWRAGH